MVKSVLGALLVLCCLPGCGSSPEPVKKVKPVSSERLAGRVQNVNEVSGFVLIRRYGGWHVDEGELVESRGVGRTANLMPTGEKLGEHVAADIRSGKVEVGDAVYIRRLVISKDPKPSEEPENSTGL
jgi:hypothetical protein